MVIRASAATEIRSLIDALRGSDDVRREAAIARLAVIGPRAVEKLVAAYREGDESSARIAILRALEPIGDPRALDVAQQALTAGGDPATSAAGVLRNLLDSPHADVAAAALDTLVATVLNTEARSRTRVAALEALQDMPPRVRARVADAVRSDPALKASAPRVARDGGAVEAVWQEAAAGRLPDDPADVEAAVQNRAASAALTSLQKMIDAARAKETEAQTPETRAAWATARGALHQALAARGSRVALYDLRESFAEAAAPLPVSFLAALQVLGDASCLEPIASAYRRARREEGWWRQQLASAFRAICKRERVTKRNAVLKRIASRCPDIIS